MSLLQRLAIAPHALCGMQLAPFPSSRPSAKELAAQKAKELEALEPPAPFPERFVVCLLGLQGAGKTSTINRLMGKDATDPFEESTRGGCKILDAELHGIPFRFIDTPGLEVGTEAERANKRKLDCVHSLSCPVVC
jgi:predicted GTPase